MKVFNLSTSTKPEKWFRPTQKLSPDGFWQPITSVVDWFHEKYNPWQSTVYSIIQISEDIVVVYLNGAEDKGILYKGDFKL